MEKIINEKINTVSNSVEVLKSWGVQFDEEAEDLEKKIKSIGEIKDSIDRDINSLTEHDFRSLASLLDLTEERFNYLYVTLDAIKRGFPVTLTDYDKETISMLKKKINDKLVSFSDRIYMNNSESSRIALLVNDFNKSLTVLEEILHKINSEDFEPISTSDFQVIYSTIIEDSHVSNSDKINLLAGIKRHNTRVILSVKKEEPVLKESSKKYSFEQIYNLLSEYIANEKSLKRIKSFKKELEENLDLDNARSVLEYLNNITVKNGSKLLNKFTIEALLALVTYSNVDAISKRYEMLKENNLLVGFFFDTPSAWNDVNKDSGRVGYRINDEDQKLSLKYYANCISFEDIMANYRLLREHNVDVSLEGLLSSDRVLKTSSEVLKEKIDIFEYYGVYDNKNKGGNVISILYCGDLADKFDHFIEVELLNGTNGKSSVYTDSVKRYQSVVSRFSKEHFALLSKLLYDNDIGDYYHKIFSASRLGMFSADFINKKFGYRLKTQEDYERFVFDNFVSLSELLPHYEVYNEIINDNDRYDYDEDILLLPEIMDLEERFKESKYVYRFNDRVVSRLKVLRNYTALKSSGIDLDGEALMYSICNGCYFNESTINYISESINYDIGLGME